MFAHFGSSLLSVSQCRYAFSRHSSIQSGSPFFIEMSLTISSLSPRGAMSDSISNSNPHLYPLSSTPVSREMTCCVVIVAAFQSR